MNNTLIVKTFDREKEASHVLDTISASQELKNFGLKNAVVITKDQAGLIALYQRWQLPATPVDPDSRLSKLFAEAIFCGFPKIKLERLVAAGFDERFLNEMVASLQPDGSALLYFIPRNNLIDERRLLDALASITGTLHKTSFPDEVLETTYESASNE